MSENCPNCGYNLDDFYRNKIENNLKKDYEEKNKKIIDNFNIKFEQKNIENIELKSKLKNNESLLRARIIKELESEFSYQRVGLETKNLELEGKVQDLKNNKAAEAKLIVLKELQKQKKELSIEFELREVEKEKEILDLKKAIEDLKEMTNQGSQQAQGEAAEIYLENTLRSEFPLDIIEEVPKGINGADISIYVRDSHERKIGLIYIESKNAKKFSTSWLSKFSNDLQEKRANFGILVTTDLPNNYKSLEKNNLFICGFNDYLLAVKLLRAHIIEVAKTKLLDAYRDDKKTLIYNYVTSNEFANWFRGMLEYMIEQKKQLTIDKRQAQKSFAIREKQIEKLFNSHEMLLGHFRGLGSGEDFSILENFRNETLDDQ